MSVHLAAAAKTALTTSYQVLAMTGTTTDEALARPIQDECHLGLVHGELDTIAGGASAVTWYLSADAAGDVPLTPEVTTVIVAGKTTATDGGFGDVVDIDYRRFSSGVAGTVHLVAKLDAGTANCIPRIIWSTR